MFGAGITSFLICRINFSYKFYLIKYCSIPFYEILCDVIKSLADSDSIFFTASCDKVNSCSNFGNCTGQNLCSCLRGHYGTNCTLGRFMSKHHFEDVSRSDLHQYS